MPRNIQNNNDCGCPELEATQLAINSTIGIYRYLYMDYRQIILHAMDDLVNMNRNEVQQHTATWVAHKQNLTNRISRGRSKT